MRRLFDFDFLNLVSLEPISLIQIPQIPQLPNDGPLNAEVNGDDGDNTLVGTSGSDTLNGFGGNDTLDGLGGTNTLTGGTGTDTFIVSQRDGNTTRIIDFEDGVELIDLSGMGVSSFDQLVPFLSQDGADVLLFTGWGFESERLFINNITLADISAADFIFDTTSDGLTIQGISGGSTIFGSLGDDVITGGTGSDDIHGGDGDDILNGGVSGSNTLIGGTGTDTFVVSQRDGHTTRIIDFEDGVELIDLSGMGVSSFDQLVPFLSQDGADVLLLTGIGFETERLFINNITLADLSAADFVFDTISDGLTIQGGSGGSTIFGSLGDDVITGGTGSDDIHGGCLLYTSPSPRDKRQSRMPSSA